MNKTQKVKGAKFDLTATVYIHEIGAEWSPAVIHRETRLFI